ncbi:hypothetical protein EIN_429830 [Entamoeba invadens IP1]|uniref:Uncharacterized protein n=1 Tax=Entamoeba invadens IP1 TaxID=370355 RepID=A0A0A1UHF0_ENTIV|nr:hypothetical protein EIN_429830 [Entamoeba invadens IP1]ELP95207.1 hypothetical protein EIN_429830 [Entamoeba invadens IP1]|eukprot:XP_004261978.1 hypothetical protein EIN_429830 [Entamoeba invadens IP1]
MISVHEEMKSNTESVYPHAHMKDERQCVTPLEKRIPVLKASRESRNFQTLQQSLCIGLLSSICEVTIKQPAKKSVVTQQYMRIKSLDFGDGEILVVNEFLKKRCIEQKNDDVVHGVPQKTAVRRFQNNKKIELLHLLIDLLEIRGGFDFESKYTEGKVGTNKQESIKKVMKEGCVIIGAENLIEKADCVNKIITDKLANCKKELIIKRKDKTIAEVLHTFF